ncbi:MAG: MltA domain-containing protein [Elusimicrobiales bacterium]|jgi:membrane-bound lytic murein transglycosylase A
MTRAVLSFCLSVIPIPPGAAAQEALRTGSALEFETAAPGPRIGTLETCPKFQDFRRAAAYPNAPSNLKAVTEVPADTLPLPEDDLDRAGLLAALKDTLNYWRSRPGQARVLIGGDAYTAARMLDTTQKLIDIFSTRAAPEELRELIKTGFRTYRSVADDNSGKVVITGYYEAEIKAVRRPDAVNRFPIYLRPPDLVKTTPEMGVDFDYGRVDGGGKLVKYYPRADISGGSLDGGSLELAWSDHPARIMLLQIQGSGILRFPDGDFIKVGFDGANGWPFKSVQRILIDCGEVPPMSFKDFINYLSLQGERERRLVDLNPRYIFFRSRPKDSPAYGAINAGLTPGRSVAVDPKSIPLGVTALLSSTRPVAGPDGALSFRQFTRFVAAHDTGSAIRGPGRIDLFWGAGETAETEASSMKAEGDIYILVAR